MKHVLFRKLTDRAYLLDGLDGYFRLPLSLSRDDPKRRRFRDMIFSWLDVLILVPTSSIQENFSI